MVLRPTPGVLPFCSGNRKPRSLGGSTNHRWQSKEKPSPARRSRQQAAPTRIFVSFSEAFGYLRQLILLYVDTGDLPQG